MLFYTVLNLKLLQDGVNICARQLQNNETMPYTTVVRNTDYVPQESVEDVPS